MAKRKTSDPRVTPRSFDDPVIRNDMQEYILREVRNTEGIMREYFHRDWFHMSATFEGEELGKQKCVLTYNVSENDGYTDIDVDFVFYFHQQDGDYLNRISAYLLKIIMAEYVKQTK